MSVPKLNVRLELEGSARQGDGMGGYRIVWQRIGSLWAEMKAGTGRERGAGRGRRSGGYGGRPFRVRAVRSRRRRRRRSR